MKILLTGAAGQLGQELHPQLRKLGDVIAVDISPGSAAGLAWRGQDMADEGRFETFLNRTLPDLVVNAAAYTAVDQAEKDKDLAFRVNASAPGRIARWVERNDSALLHYSTDYVFDGTQNGPYREPDTATPLNSYGDSKFAGEQAIRASGCRHVILRSSWIYSSHGKNFVLTMLELAKRGLDLRVVGDQFGCPTWARNLADYSIKAIRSGLVGRKRLGSNLYHCCDRDGTSWYDFASLVFSTALDLGILQEMPRLAKVRSDEYPQTANRPRNSVLDTGLMQRELRIKPAGLEQSLRNCLREIKTHDRS